MKWILSGKRQDISHALHLTAPRDIFIVEKIILRAKNHLCCSQYSVEQRAFFKKPCAVIFLVEQCKGINCFFEDCKKEWISHVLQYCQSIKSLLI